MAYLTKFLDTLGKSAAAEGNLSNSFSFPGFLPKSVRKERKRMFSKATRPTGVVLAVLATAHMLSLAWQYGWSEGLYFQLPTIAVLLLGAGLILGSRALITTVVTVSLFPLVLYGLDDIWHLVSGNPLLGVSNFAYNAGLAWAPAVLSHTHWFFWPAAVLGWYGTRADKKSLPRVLAYSVGFYTFVGVLSVLVFPAHQNLNCAIEPCFGEFWPRGIWLYRLSFLAILVAFQAAAYQLLKHLPKVPRAKLAQRRWIYRMAGAAAAGFALVVWSGASYFRSAHFRCGPSFEDGEVKVGCSYVSEWGSDKLVLAYSVFNKASRPRFCDSQINTGDGDKALHEGIWAEPKTNTEVWVVVPKPAKDISARLLARCHD
ncbi:hypothetical protein K2X33_06295 [bacterium]|nr:hypothetical protein [bacterium]